MEVAGMDLITNKFFGKIDELMIFRNEKPKEKIIGADSLIELIKRKKAV